METRKIALACFIGGAMLVAVALAVAPSYWWLGILAGIAGGYLSYEFREVLQSIPIAFAKARQGSRVVRVELAAYFKKPHPLGYPITPLTLAFYCAINQFLVKGSVGVLYFPGRIILSVLSILLSLLLLSASFLVSICLLDDSAKRDRSYFRNLLSSRDLEARIKSGYREISWNYGEVYHRLFLELGRVLALGVWWVIKTPFLLLFLLWRAIPFTVRFCRFLVIAIHSHKRVLCAVDGTIGGLVVYLNFARFAVSMPEKVLLIFFGGLLGAAFGVLNWEIVSKRILKLVPVKAT
ncbi:MAG: hypothetical protein HY093_00950 [Candidatus Liptonbacteria bacterium]|nr:hypothetical protein [Candidatus Liptonbacteria bacterium]